MIELLESIQAIAVALLVIFVLIVVYSFLGRRKRVVFIGVVLIVFFITVFIAIFGIPNLFRAALTFMLLASIYYLAHNYHNMRIDPSVYWIMTAILFLAIIGINIYINWPPSWPVILWTLLPVIPMWVIGGWMGDSDREREEEEKNESMRRRQEYARKAAEDAKTLEANRKIEAERA